MPGGGSVLLLLGGAVAAAVLAAVYVYAEWYIPFVYLNFVLCIGFGVLLGFGLARLVRAGKLRSPGAVSGLALLVGLLAVYLQWCLYLTLLFNSETTGTGRDADTTTSFSGEVFAGLLASPGTVLEALRKVNENGVWELKGLQPSGVLLWLIWALEAAIIVGGAVLLARHQAAEPFSEVSQEWADEETLPHSAAYAHDAAGLRTALETGRFEHLTPYAGQPGEDQFARVQLHCAPNDPNCHYLTLQNVRRTLDKKGKATEATTDVLRHLAISPSAYQELKARFSHPAPPSATPGDTATS